MELTKEQKKNIFRNTSGNYLTDYIPEDWDDLNEAEQDRFLESHVIQVYEYHNATQVCNLISNASDATINWIENNL